MGSLLASLDSGIWVGYLESLFGVYSVRFDNAGVRRPASDDLQIQGISNPRDFRKAVLTRLSNMKIEAFSRHISSPATKMFSSNTFEQGSISHTMMMLQKLEEVGSSLKRVETLIEKRHHHTLEAKG